MPKKEDEWNVPGNFPNLILVARDPCDWGSSVLRSRLVFRTAVSVCSVRNNVDYNPVVITTDQSLSDSVPNVRRRPSWS